MYLTIDNTIFLVI